MRDHSMIVVAILLGGVAVTMFVAGVVLTLARLLTTLT